MLIILDLESEEFMHRLSDCLELHGRFCGLPKTISICQLVGPVGQMSHWPACHTGSCYLPLFSTQRQRHYVVFIQISTSGLFDWTKLIRLSSICMFSFFPASFLEWHIPYLHLHCLKKVSFCVISENMTVVCQQVYKESTTLTTQPTNTCWTKC